ncbi:hypothetical protein FALBO_15787 [Fusarium albosuccineum]|uniref:Avirulence Effector AvrLm4-7 domain-containing protein n=1 Tax=Fusarium albosuccineum TaxID=1237068 RepID=A0A8H4KS14_9HYPO|nr:hypothetical protein FALBO_15787 [Fusarium albosuccineum]
MLFKSTLLLALAPFLGACDPLPTTAGPGLNTRQSCLVNREKINMWVEDGLTRWRVAFSAEGTKPEDYCYYWMGKNVVGCRSHFNPQCWYKEDLGTWVVDASTTRGNDDSFWSYYETSLKRWIQDTGCRTG